MAGPETGQELVYIGSNFVTGLFRIDLPIGHPAILAPVRSLSGMVCSLARELWVHPPLIAHFSASAGLWVHVVHWLR